MKKYNKYEPGMRYGKLTLVERTENPRIWECVCDCGEAVFTQISHGSRSCKKCAYEINAQSRIIHGDSNNKQGICARLYRIWTGMKTRCYNPKNHSFKEYGLRGITVCDDWNFYLNFRDWSLDHGYSEHLELDRIDVNGNYEPSNCRWVSHAEQMKNTRHNRIITIDNQTMVFSEWLKYFGLWKSSVYISAKRQEITVEKYLEQRYYELINLPCAKRNESKS